jgi:hypothetical protein
MQPQSQNDILQAIQTLAGQVGSSVPAPTIPTLGYTAPNTSDISAKYQEFLNRAAKDPDIVNYYNQILQQAQGDTNIAQGFLENDYQTGVRNTVENLQGSLKQLGLSFATENKQQEDTLNKRGIALTQDANGKLTYGGGGQSQDEIQQTREGQSLRQEAEKRSAQQSITGLANTLKKGISSTGQQLTQTAQNLQQQKNSDIANRAGTYMGLYSAQQAASANDAANKQQFAMNNPKPDMPAEGAYPNVGTKQGGYRWNGKGWDQA